METKRYAKIKTNIKVGIVAKARYIFFSRAVYLVLLVTRRVSNPMIGQMRQNTPLSVSKTSVHNPRPRLNSINDQSAGEGREGEGLDATTKRERLKGEGDEEE